MSKLTALRQEIEREKKSSMEAREKVSMLERSQKKETEGHTSQLTALQDQMENDKKSFVVQRRNQATAHGRELAAVRQEIEREKEYSTNVSKKVSVLERSQEKEAEGHAS